MVTEQNIYQGLAALKDAGVTRARFGDVELEFAPSVETTETEDVPRVISVAPIAPQSQDPHVANRPGYADIFGTRPPRFTPAEK